MKNLKRILALVLCAALLLTLFAGCNKTQDTTDNKGDGTNTGDKSNQGASQTSTDTMPEYVYRPQYSPFPGDFQWINNAVFSADRIFFSTEEAVGAHRNYYDENWNLLGFLEIDPSEIGEGNVGIVFETDDALLSSSSPVTTAEGEDDESESGDTDLTPEDGDITDEQGRHYCEELDIWYMYSYDEQVTEQVIYSMKLDGTDLKKLPDYKKPELPENQNGYIYTNWFRVDPDGNLWICEDGSMYHYDDNDQYVYDGELRYIRKLSPTGAELFTLDTKRMQGDAEYAYYSNPIFGEDGSVYLYENNENNLFILDKDGSIKSKLDLGDRYINNLFFDQGELFAVYYKDEVGEVMAPVDLKTGSFGEEIKIPNYAYSFITGGGDYPLYFNSQSGVYGFDPKTEKTEILVNWIECDINSDTISNVFVSGDGTIYAVSQDYETSDGSMELVKFTLVPSSSIPQKTELTLACVYLDYQLRRAILQFNKSSDTYRIKLVDYSIFNTEDDYNAGTTKLSTEIISGVVPDLLFTQNLPINTYAKKGLLEDLLPYLKNDPELKDSVLYEAYEPVMTEDGKLPIVAAGFSIETLAGAAAVVGDTPAWTMQDMQAALSRMPEGARAFSNTMTRSEMLNYLCRMTQDDYIDYENGKCHFDSDEFKSFLKFIASYPEEINWEDMYGEDYNWETDGEESQVAMGKQMLYRTYLSDFYSYQYLQGIFLNKAFTFVGFPSTSGKGSVIEYRLPVAMSSACKDKDGAWEFLRTVLSPDFDTWGFSTNKDLLMKAFKDFTEPQYYTDENGKQVEYELTQYVAGKEIKVDRMTQAHFDQILDVLNHCTASTSIDQKILDIISEDTQAFFKGQKSVDDVCASIQSRVTIYINENM